MAWASGVFPFAIAAVLPPAGLILGILALEDDRGHGWEIIGVSLVAAIVWALVLLG
jgi:hypothetical protein